MWSAPLVLALELPPLAFGPAQPRVPAPPRALTCAIRDLGRIQEPARSPWPASRRAPLAPGELAPSRESRLVNPFADGLMLMAFAYGTRATWDDRTWSTKTWQSTGAVTPVLIPPQAPPMWSIGR